jgi:hypothetical protein
LPLSKPPAKEGKQARNQIEKEVFMRKLLVLGVLSLLVLLVILSACTRERIINQIIADTSCFECHSDQNTFLLAAERQWLNSAHASGERLYGRRTCNGCHSNEGFVVRMTTGSFSSDAIENPTPIHCFTCHAPHTNGNLTLRTYAPYTMEDGAIFDKGTSNLCVNCHHARRDVNSYISDPEEFTSTHWGPHHNDQGDMLIGSNGYEYPGYNYENSPHTTRTINGCVDCHMYPSGTLVLGGHSWNMHEDGEEHIDACNQSGCHATITEFNRVTAEFPNGVQDSVETLLETLAGELLAAGLIDSATLHPIPDVIISADSAGAVWIFLFVEEEQSHGIHNTRYAVGLLESSSKFIQWTCPFYLPGPA